MRLLIFVLSTLILGSSAKFLLQDEAPWTPVDWRTLPKASPTDDVEILLLVAPLMEDTYGSLFKYINCYHGAIGFRNLRSNLTITINYDAENFVHSSMFPEINKFPNGTRYLTWLNAGNVFIYMGINDTYWITKNEVIGVMSGAMYNDFISGYNAQVNSTHPFYNLFALADHFGGTVFVKGWTCWDYVMEALQQLYTLGAQFDYTKKIKRDDMYFYSGTVPENVTGLYYSDPTFRSLVIDFYELIQFKVKDVGFLELILTIFEVYEGNFFVRIDNDYWKIRLHWPFFGIDYVTVPLPGKPSSQGRRISYDLNIN